MRTAHLKVALSVLILCLLSACAGFEMDVPIPDNATNTPATVVEEDETEPTLLVTWQRSGGFAGVCQKMDILTDGAYTLTDCRLEEVAASGKLAPKDLDWLLEQASQVGSANWETPQTELYPDAFNDSYTFYGTGQNSLTSEELRSLDDELAALAQRLGK